VMKSEAPITYALPLLNRRTPQNPAGLPTRAGRGGMDLGEVALREHRLGHIKLEISREEESVVVTSLCDKHPQELAPHGGSTTHRDPGDSVPCVPTELLTEPPPGAEEQDADRQLLWSSVYHHCEGHPRAEEVRRHLRQVRDLADDDLERALFRNPPSAAAIEGAVTRLGHQAGLWGPVGGDTVRADLFSDPPGGIFSEMTKWRVQSLRWIAHLALPDLEDCPPQVRFAVATALQESWPGIQPFWAWIGQVTGSPDFGRTRLARALNLETQPARRQHKYSAGEVLLASALKGLCRGQPVPEDWEMSLLQVAEGV